MKILLTSLFVFLFLVHPEIYAQEYHSGYIIKQNKDTIYGLIKEGTDEELSLQVEFKEHNDLEKQVFSPGDLRGFRFDNGRTFRQMENRRKTPDQNKYVFAKNIVEGEIDMLVWRQKDFKNPDIFLVNNATGETVHLTGPVKKYFLGEKGKTYSKQDKNYLGLLNYITGKWDDNQEFRYSEKKIRRYIQNYNETYSKGNPGELYVEEVKYDYDMMVGLPVLNWYGNEEIMWRAAVLRNKTYVEKRKHVSYIRGIFYRQWSNPDKEIEEDHRNGTANYRWQLLNAVPWGIKYQRSAGWIKPYAYLGVGLGIVMMTNYEIVEYENTGSTTDFLFFPTLNVGTGVKFKAGANSILAELTPSLDGVFLNLGYSF